MTHVHVKSNQKNFNTRHCQYIELDIDAFEALSKHVRIERFNLYGYY